MAIVALPYVDVDEQQVARVFGKRTKVVQLVLDQRAFGWDVATLHENYPHLSLAEIHAALAYYHDHRQQVDDQIAAGESEIAALKAALPTPPLVERLRKASPTS